LADVRPVYGVFLPDEVEAARRGRSLDVRELASRYRQAIEQHAGQGPVQLAGVSFGATVAYEVAQQWSGAEQRVSLLALLDPLMNRSLGIWAPLERGMRSWRAWRQERRDRATAKGRPDLDDAALERRRSVVLDAAEQAYERGLRPYAGRALVVSATGVAPGAARPSRGRGDLGWFGRHVSADLGWKPLLPADSSVVVVDGTHLGILAGSAVQHVAAVFRDKRT
jgi:thioesterase domain-containing protein